MYTCIDISWSKRGKLQEVISETNNADMINERWNEVLERLDQLSIEYAKELQAEKRIRYQKNGQQLGYMVIPPVSSVGDQPDSKLLGRMDKHFKETILGLRLEED
jgi:hypothetical protein